MKKILIINSNYYNDISKNLVFAAKKRLNYAKFKIQILNVPGVFEIPIAIRKNIKKFDGFIALGCVIKGKTPHFDLISKATFNALMSLSINFNKPIGNGIITSLNLAQARQRSDRMMNLKPNKGSEAANAVIAILKNEPKNF